jgi:hypothetical protein
MQPFSSNKDTFKIFGDTKVEPYEPIIIDIPIESSRFNS